MSKMDPTLQLPPTNHNYQIFNSHCHLNDDSQFNQIDNLIEQAKNFNVTNFIVVGSNKILNDRAIYISENFSNCIPAIGWHPDSWNEYSDKKLIHLLNDYHQIPIIGEIGLDYHYSKDDIKEQQFIFSSQLEIAKKYQLPVSIHTREAFEDTIKILKEKEVSQGVIHNFNTGPKQAEKYLEQGLMLSISGVVTFKNAEELRESLRIIPLDRLLIETDDPYLTPVPFRGKTNHPAYAYFTLKYISEYLQIDINTLANQTFKNTERLIGEK